MCGHAWWCRDMETLAGNGLLQIACSHKLIEKFESDSSPNPKRNRN